MSHVARPHSRSGGHSTKLWLFSTVILLALLVVGISSVAAQATPAAPFPVTVEHKFGSTTVPKAPQRVVTLGFRDQDPILALGVTPVAVRYWYGDETDAIFPWADGETDGTEPIVLNMVYGTLDYEAILALKPDLIVATDAGITEAEFDLLSQIAPTIAQSGDYKDFGMPWQAITQHVGAALGKSEQASELVGDVEATFADARQENPQFTGKSVAVVYGYEAGSYGYYTAEDSRARFFTDLGFVIPDELTELAGDSFYVDVSAEQIGLLDRDLLVFVGLQFVDGGREEIESDPLFSQLDAVKEGRALYVADDLDDALQFSTILSLPYVLEGLLPALQAILPNPAATETASATEAA